VRRRPESVPSPVVAAGTGVAEVVARAGADTGVDVGSVEVGVDAGMVAHAAPAPAALAQH
jgi:hypothetical protein